MLTPEQSARIATSTRFPEAARANAFNNIYHHLWPRLVVWYEGFVGSHEQAEEICQDAMVSLWRNLDGAPHTKAGLSGFASHGAQWQAINAIRHSSKEPEFLPLDAIEDREQNVLGRDPRQSADPEFHIDVIDAIKAVSGLSGNRRRVLVLAMLGCTNHEIAAMLDISYGNVKIILHRARSELAADPKA